MFLNEKQKEKNSLLLEILSLGITFCLVFLFVSNALQLVTTEWLVPVEVDGTSMVDTLQDGDVLLYNRLAKPKFGDIVVVQTDIRRSDGSLEKIIKRIVGLPGDVLWTEDGYLFREYTDEKGRRVSGRVEESYLNERNAGNTWRTSNGYATDMIRIIVPEGEYYVMGDNRTNSLDSRRLGTFTRDRILGVVSQKILKSRNLIKAIFG